MKAKGAFSAEGLPAVKPAEEEAPYDPNFRVCPKCSSADPLNRDFCVICGTKIPKRERVSGVTSSVMVQSELMSLKEEISTVQAVRSQAQAPLRVPGYVIFPVLALVGLSLGCAAGLYNIERTVPPPAASAFPDRGLSMITAVPYADIFVELPDRRDFIFGRTGKSGQLALEELVPGTYKVDVNGSGGENFGTTVMIERGKPALLGAPPDKPLLSKGE